MFIILYDLEKIKLPYQAEKKQQNMHSFYIVLLYKTDHHTLSHRGLKPDYRSNFLPLVIGTLF